MKLTCVVALTTFAAANGANGAAFNLRRREQSIACSVSELDEFECGLPGGSKGATVCRDGFTACINPADHDEDDTCGPCPKVVDNEEPRVEQPTIELPLCSSVDVADFACALADGNTGALTCQNGFTACIALGDISTDDTCGCCAGDSSPRCQEQEEIRFVDTITTILSLACDALQLQEYSCTIDNSTVGAYVCRGGFSACIPTENHTAMDTCGMCPIVDVPEETRVEIPDSSLPVCSEVELEDFACTLADGSSGALVCHAGFTACKGLDDIEGEDSCGCCAGDTTGRCSPAVESRNMNPPGKAKPVCNAAQLSENVCDLADGTVGATVCRQGFTACINTQALHSDDLCGACVPVETPEEPRVEIPEEPLPVCGDVNVADFVCALDDGSSGALVCNNGFTACMPTAEIEDDFSCGCCAGDGSPRCQEIEEPRLISLEAVSESSLACSAMDLELHSCNVTAGIVGASVCRNGFTACIQADAHLATDTCGECPSIVIPEEVRGDEELIEAETTETKCTDEKIAEFDCSLPDGTVGVYTCTFGFTSCVAIDSLTEASTCGCCPGDNKEGCLSTKDTPALMSRNADFDLP